MANIKELICAKAMDTFRRFGYKNVTMDDLSRELSMSKKTIYQYYPNKESLMTDTIETMLDSSEKEINEVFGNTENAMERMFWMLKYRIELAQKINMKCIFDLKKYYPKIWTTTNKFTEKVFQQNIEQNLIEGKKDGYYRPEINEKIITTLFYYQTSIFTDSLEHRPNSLGIEQVIQEFLVYHFNGICTDKGRQQIPYYSEKYFTKL